LFYTFEKSLADLGEVGLSQLLCVDWLLTCDVVLSEVGLSCSVHLWGRELSMYLQEAFSSLTKATSGCEDFASLQVSHSWSKRWAITCYFCLVR